MGWQAGLKATGRTGDKQGVDAGPCLAIKMQERLP